MVDTVNVDEGAGGDGGEDVTADIPSVKSTPLCLECMEPVDPYSYYCDNCGQATNGLTQYLPFVNIRWTVNFYVKVCRQVWSRDVSIFGRFVRLLVIIMSWPILLIVMLCLRPKKSDREEK